MKRTGAIGRKKQALVERQLRQRQTLVKEIRRMREIQSEDMARLAEDVALFLRLGERETPDVQADFRDAAQPWQEPKTHDQERERPDLGRDDGLDFGM